MRSEIRGVISFIAWFVLMLVISAPVSAANEVFIVSADGKGIANYMVSYGDEHGTLSSQEQLMLMGNDGFYPMGESGIDYFGSGVSNGNGMGDFDNDGDLDYIMGHGRFGGDIFVFEKIGSDNEFASPVPVAGWSAGMHPMDMAVADFDEDGNLDFVMSYHSSSNCGLYLGDGNLGFTVPDTNPAEDHLLLENTAPYVSAGVDAADFNGDGHMDFVVAPYIDGRRTDEPFFVNLGDGKGHFETHTFTGATDANGSLAPYYGVAAADFNSDGYVDIAAAYYGYLDVYKGDGEGGFEWFERYGYDLKLSALDNWDFDGDGNQDLVAANYGPPPSGRSAVAVFLGLGDGTFDDPVTYGGGNEKARSAVSAPPYLPLDINEDPVAILDLEYSETIVGKEIVFDGSRSTDYDGQIYSYAWDFGDGTSISVDTAGLNQSLAQENTDAAKPSHIYYEPGEYIVALTVTDDKGATNTVEVEVIVLPVAATVRFKPYTLYLNSKDKRIWATVRLPADYDARDIHDTSVCIVFENGGQICANADYGRGFLADMRKRFLRKKNALTVRFDRQKLLRQIQSPAENIELKVRGDVLSDNVWVEFEGSGTIRVREQREAFFGRYWKRHFRHFSKNTRSICRK